MDENKEGHIIACLCSIIPTYLLYVYGKCQIWGSHGDGDDTDLMDMIPCWFLYSCWHFQGTWCLHVQGPSGILWFLQACGLGCINFAHHYAQLSKITLCEIWSSGVVQSCTMTRPLHNKHFSHVFPYMWNIIWWFMFWMKWPPTVFIMSVCLLYII